MKTTFYIAILMVISFIAITPSSPREYPPKSVIKQRESIVFKENSIDHLIDRIEHEQKVDSIQLKIIQNESSQTN